MIGSEKRVYFNPVTSISRSVSRLDLVDSPFQRLSKLKRSVVRLVLNDIPTRLVNAGYNSYSRFYEGQLRLGLPVSRELLKTQEEIRNSAAGKLALTLYHIFFRSTGSRIPRIEIKIVLLDELQRGNVRLTENVIILNLKQLKYLALERFRIPERFFPAILEEAKRRRILRESLKNDRLPAYFESEIDEREENGRGDYEIVYYRDFTDEGKEIKFRRLLSMEDVTAGDNRPSVLLVPGLANNSNCFNVSNRYSIAKDMADMGYWVYLFDPRGMGVNEGQFDPLYTVDTLIDYDLATVLRFINSRSKGKPTILLGHSMGGIVSESMVLNWNLRLNFDQLSTMQPEHRCALNKMLPPQEESADSLDMVRAIISLGSPKFFERQSHLIFPSILWINHLARVFGMQRVPVREVFWFLTKTPLIKEISQLVLNSNVADLNFIVCPENHEDKRFAQRYLDNVIESIPLGLGFQFLKAIYNGEGFKRMDATRLNYTALLNHFPDQIPVFHFWGTRDPLASPRNLRFSEHYPHKVKKVYEIYSVEDLKQVEIASEKSQLIDFVIHGASHFDLLYGKVAEQIIYPLILRIVHQVWDEWSYDKQALKN